MAGTAGASTARAGTAGASTSGAGMASTAGAALPGRTRPGRAWRGRAWPGRAWRAWRARHRARPGRSGSWWRAAGLAGLRTVEELRASGYAGAVTLVGAETRPPYDRPPLSKRLMAGDLPIPRCATTWTRSELTLRLGETATGLDDGVLRTDRGEHRFDRLVLATGAAPVRLPGGGPQRVLRTLDDALALRAPAAARACGWRSSGPAGSAPSWPRPRPPGLPGDRAGGRRGPAGRGGRARGRRADRRPGMRRPASTLRLGPGGGRR